MQLPEAHKLYGADLARYVVNSHEVALSDLQKVAHRRAQAALAALYLRDEALRLADALSGQPLTDARAAADPFKKAITEATKSLAVKQEQFKEGLVKMVQAFKPDGSGSVPTGDRRELAAAEKALADARAAARESDLHLRRLEGTIEQLRQTPGPDPADLAVLVAALKGGGHAN
ncbi:MAG: hypothetical protein JXA57_15655 [Armatimonadetes bacterium]|nr:hypothetical protein [Armatimonadota bacterium]